MNTNYQCYDCKFCVEGNHIQEYYCAFDPRTGKVNYESPAFSVMKNDPACENFKEIR